MFNIQNIIGAVFAPAVLLAIFALFRKQISNLIAGKIQSGFDKQMEVLRSELRIEESKLLKRIESRDREISEIRSTILGVGGARSSELERKRISAHENIWINTQKYKSAQFAMENAKILKLDKISEMGSSDLEKMKIFSAGINKGADIDGWMKTVKELDHSTDRLYVSPEVWARYSAIRSVVSTAVTIMKILEINPEHVDLVKSENLEKIIVDIIPAAKEGFIKFGFSWAFFQVDFLIEDLLSEMKKFFDGEQFDQSEIERASRASLLASKNLGDKKIEVPEIARNHEIVGY